MKVISVNIGERKVLNYKGKIVETGIFKFPVNHPVFLGTEDVENDAVIDRKYHGGIAQAVYGYSQNHYAYWKVLYPDLDWNYGMFGENLSISNLEETEIINILNLAIKLAGNSLKINLGQYHPHN